ncbi:MAG: AMP-binding protein [Alphaproteobacteria bacterium]
MAETQVTRQASTFPWLQHYPPSTPHNVDDKLGKTLVDLLEESKQQYASRPAVESFGVSLTYAQVDEIANKVAGFLQAKGLVKGDRVAIFMPNVAAYIPILFGVLKAGGIVVNTNPLYTPRELTHQMKDSGAKFIFFLSLFEKTVAAADKAVSFDTMVRVEVGDLLGLKGRLISVVARRKQGVTKKDRQSQAISLQTALKEGAKHGFVPVPITPDDLAFLQYTGGTTGVSKGAMLQHSNVQANTEQCVAWFDPVLDRENKRHIMIGALPLYHIFALTGCAFFTLRIGGTALLITNPRDLKTFTTTLRKRPFTIFVGINTLFSALADHPDFPNADFSHLSVCIGGGMATKSIVAEKWKKITGFPIIEGYGLSETSPGATFNSPRIDCFTGAIGFPWPSTEVRILDAEGQPVAEGEIGEIAIKGPQVMRGYWNRPEETARVFTEDGFFRSGDMGLMLPDGQFKLVDRLKEMINVSGFNVYPNEVEDVIIQMPEVKDIAVVGLPDDHSGEAVTAFVIKRDENLTEQQIRDYCRETLTGYKVPKKVVFKEELPKSNVGKVLRRVLYEEAVGGKNLA